MRTRSKAGLQLAAVAAAAAMLVSACSSSGSNAGTSVTVGLISAQDAGPPVDGGSITFGSYSFPASLDPTVTPVAGYTGGTEMAAIYDTLMRSDATTQIFEPQLAKSLTSNDDFTEYTMELRDGVTFSDGTPVNSEAVKWSLERYVAAGSDVAQEWSNSVTEVSTPDADTVVFALTTAWSGFPVMLTMGPGMIVAPASVQGDTFAPIGAGPFTMTKFAQDERLVLTSRADYHGGTPHLDTVQFVPTNGARSQFESMQSGQLDVAFIYRDEEVILDTQDAGYSGYLDIQGLGSIGLINNRAGRPGADPRVRQAIALGIFPEDINQRSNNGLGIADSAILPETSRWHTGAEGLAYDPDRAKELLNEAKADGYNGDLTYLATAEPSAQAAALASQAALNAIGFNVTIDHAASVTDLVQKIYINHDFDLTRSGDGLMDESPYLRLYSSVGSDSHNNASGYADPQMDTLLDKVKASATDDDLKAALAEVQSRVNETVPYAIWGPSKVLVAWNSRVHGVQRSSDNIMLLGGAWIAPA